MHLYFVVLDLHCPRLANSLALIHRSCRWIGFRFRSGKKKLLNSGFSASQIRFTTRSLSTSTKRKKGCCFDPIFSFPLVAPSCDTRCAAHRHDVFTKAPQSFPRASHQSRPSGSTSRPLRTSTLSPHIVVFSPRSEFVVVSASIRAGASAVPAWKSAWPLAYTRDRDRRTHPSQRLFRHAL